MTSDAGVYCFEETFFAVFRSATPNKLSLKANKGENPRVNLCRTSPEKLRTAPSSRAGKSRRTSARETSFWFRRLGRRAWGQLSDRECSCHPLFGDKMFGKSFYLEISPASSHRHLKWREKASLVYRFIQRTHESAELPWQWLTVVRGAINHRHQDSVSNTGCKYRGSYWNPHERRE